MLYLPGGEHCPVDAAGECDWSGFICLVQSGSWGRVNGSCDLWPMSSAPDWDTDWLVS